MIKCKNGSVSLDGNVVGIMEDFSYIVNTFYEMLMEDLDEESAKRVIANTCYIATAKDISDDEVKSLANDTLNAINKGLKAEK